jgi:hypothetical protein
MQYDFVDTPYKYFGHRPHHILAIIAIITRINFPNKRTESDWKLTLCTRHQLPCCELLCPARMTMRVEMQVRYM